MNAGGRTDNNNASWPRFGTDGVRGVANSEISPEYALALGRVAARHLGADRLVVGRDTRRSGPLLEAALVAGALAEGVDVVRLGVAPTPAVAWLCARDGLAGAVISASHNPFADNGIKLFGPGGLKLGDRQQDAIQAALSEPQRNSQVPTGAELGGVSDVPDLLGAYGDAVAASIEGRSLDGIALVVDCAHGAASAIGPAVLRSLGAELTVIGAEPDGANINAGCGSTDLGPLRREVLARGAALGLAFDGDADRVLAVDHTGRDIDGDQLIAAAARDLAARGRLAHEAVVVTVMSNLGFQLGMRRAGIEVRRTAVGDRHVLAELEAGGYSLGGEQSGHVIFRELATTGDGLLTAVQILDLVRRSGRTLAELADEAMDRLPQVLRNVGVVRPHADLDAALAEAVAAVEARLGEDGRVLIRASGTEPLVRVMVEAARLEDAERAAGELASVVDGLVGR